MSDYAYVADRARKVFASVSRLESEMATKPGDWALQRNLRSMQKLAQQARQELEALAQKNQIEVCEYRMVPAFGGEYALAHVTRSLLEYQNLFSQIYDSFKNGKKSRAILGREAEEESMLDFGFSYSGSLGIVLLARSYRDFFDGNLDKPIETIYQILDIEDVDSVKDIAHTLGRAVVKRIHDWSKATVEGGFSADIRWKQSNGRLRGQMIDCRKLERIVSFIESSADERNEELKIRAMLVGGDVESRTFHLSVPDGDSYRGQIASDAYLPPMTLGRIYDATINVTETYFYATERSIRANMLAHLSGPYAVDGSKEDAPRLENE